MSQDVIATPGVTQSDRFHTLGSAMHRASRRQRWIVGVLELAAVGCAGNEAGATAETRAQLELGTGVQSFEPLARGQHAKLYAGNQGGHHVWLSFRARGLSSADVQMVLAVTPEPPSMPSHWDLPIALEPVDERDPSEPILELLGWPAQVLQPECAVGTRVELDLMLEDESGTRVRATTEVIADAPDEGFSRACEGR